ncbi:tetratricopeptide repeat protein [Bacteroides finegoldii]|uniref:Tetratricopeptide repeat protein n=2 Tax=Bacteroides finegoldii TaxID=338188 RepID=A0A7J4YR26_9BACE|nr:tetratricopeptide repeat protein [Bacteroides finegoldii]KAA5222713.1 tetratricopeptide repeat protein [Bacteroides finegoldii]KAA5227112.1 tetratricopeptide repeat protein [Bacteroides finegoldii]KAA5231225.1 tetratricopeptide repeat protein [Bacteroides finegoldii]KAA5235693.1 tetratricopeptide repeat protein [Bacteroides finegoldii]
MAMVVALFSSCSKKMGPLSADYFTVTPQVLEAVSGKVPATINGKFPEKYFNKKAVVEVTPVLKWNGGEAKGQPATFQGEKVEGNNQSISYKMGGSYTMKTSFDYVPEMAKSELYLEFKATIGKKEVTIPAVKIADGVISTSELVNNTLGNANPALGEDAFQRIIKEKHDANIMFLIQQANIRSSELKTAKEFNKEVANVNEAANKKISNIEVSAYASPDGGVSLNTTLAENRENNTTKMLNKDLKKAKIDAPIDAKYTAQDWEGFQELVSKSNIQDKELILRVLSMYQDPAQREQEIKNISSVYKTLADEILPQLRRSRLTLNYEIIGKSDEEIAKLASSNPSELNIEELLYAATLTNDPAKQEAIYTQATKQFPNDYRAYNNLGKLAYQAGNIDKAESYFKKAANVNASPEVNMNLGLVSLMKGDKAAAEAYFGKAAGTKELGESMGNLYIAQGQYERAVNSFGDSKTNSAALAQILAKDYNKAKNTLANVERPDAYTDYLMAVLGARTNNSSMVTSSLKSAVAKDSSLAKKAATDLEFAKYFTNADFMNIVK